MRKSAASNKFYSIDKAELIISVNKTFGGKYGNNPDDDWTETLYRKNNGEYFVYGEGGKNTPFGKYEDGEPVSGSRYVVWLDYNDNEAKNWVYTNCPEKMKEIFEKQPDDKKSITALYLSNTARTNLKRKSREKNISMSELINQWAESLYK